MSIDANYRRIMNRRTMYIAFMALRGARGATSVQSVWMHSGWDRDMNGFNERDFIQNFRLTMATPNHSVCICLRFLPAHNDDEHQSRLT